MRTETIIKTYAKFNELNQEQKQKVIEEPYNRGIDGHDYQPDIEERLEVYWDRINKINEQENKRLIDRFNVVA